jgi:hypothetical protein
MRPRTNTVEESIGGLFHGNTTVLPDSLKTEYHLSLMSCLKGESKVKPKPGRYRCTDCGAVAKKKKDVCDPKKVKKKK